MLLPIQRRSFSQAQQLGKKAVTKTIVSGNATISIAESNLLVATTRTASTDEPVSSLAWIVPAGGRHEGAEQVGYASALRHALFLVPATTHENFCAEQSIYEQAGLGPEERAAWKPDEHRRWPRRPDDPLRVPDRIAVNTHIGFIWQDRNGRDNVGDAPRIPGRPVRAC